MKKIAIIVNSEGYTSSIMEMSAVRIYEKADNSWVMIEELPYTIDTAAGLANVRRSISELLLMLSDCKALAATEVSGQLYYILEANGFNAYEAAGEPLLYLDSILESELTEPVYSTEEGKKEEDASSCLIPRSTDQCGIYFIDLKKALALNPLLSSKKILKPFLQEKKFEALIILCDHIPRWFDMDLIALGLTSIVTKITDNEYKVTISAIH